MEQSKDPRKRAALVESQTNSQVAPNSGVEETDKAVKEAVSVDNPIVIDSSSDGLMSVRRPAVTSDFSANAALRFVCKRTAKKDWGIRTSFDFQQKQWISAHVMEHSSPIVISSTDEAEDNYPTAYESSGMEFQEGSLSPHKWPEQAVTLEPIMMEGLKSPPTAAPMDPGESSSSQAQTPRPVSEAH